MSDSTSPIDPTIAARLAQLQTLVAAARAALEAARAALEAARTRRTAAEAERDRLRSADEPLTHEVELARRRLVIAKAERIDHRLHLEVINHLSPTTFSGRFSDDHEWPVLR